MYLTEPTKKQCHAASVVYHRGTRYVTWFAGTQEGFPDSDIYLASYSMGKERLTALGLNAMGPCWNPVLFSIKDKLLLFYKVGQFCDRWLSAVIVNPQHVFDGITLKPQFLPAGLNATVKNSPLLLDNDTNSFVCGSSVETAYTWSGYLEWYHLNSAGEVRFEKRSAPIVYKAGLLQPAIWLYKSGIHMLCRYRAAPGQPEPLVYVDPKGKCTPIDTLISPNSACSAVYMDGHVWVAFNEVNRSKLVVAKLKAATMKEVGRITLEEGSAGDEFSYPYMIPLRDDLEVVYTYKRQAIATRCIDTAKCSISDIC